MREWGSGGRGERGTRRTRKTRGINAQCPMTADADSALNPTRLCCSLWNPSVRKKRSQRTAKPMPFGRQVQRLSFDRTHSQTYPQCPMPNYQFLILPSGR
ncbi:hypothetical protein [Tolypothrix sp. VBCCA 56010]|uniref:hypothetical protein n=1 Tax=Tolypothrix sp. VBCCA 56010 TaxID=3137731 RepID=UPI003D7D6E81